MRFADTTKLVDPNLVVSRRHEDWLTKYDQPVYSQRALAFAHEQLSKPGRVRMGTVSASSLGDCHRYQQFTYLGLPKLPNDAKTALKFQNGAFMHLRWQMAGLSEGWLVEAEVPVRDRERGLQGTMDGVLYDESILELKSINAHGFSGVMTFGPKHEHLFQMATYMVCTKRTKGVFIYENKDTQEYTEIVVNADEVPLEEAMVQARTLWQGIEATNLAEPLEKCIDRTGWKYQSCPFRDRCLELYTWEEALHARDSHA